MSTLSSRVTDNELAAGIKDEFGVVYSADGKRLLKCENDKIEQYEIKEGTEVICDEAFEWCEALRQIIIPESVTNIGDYAFYCCGFQQIKLPNKITRIGECSFWGCELLKQITIPDSITSIGDRVFDYCFSLQQIIIPEGSTEKFKKMLPEELWDKLYCLKKAE